MLISGGYAVPDALVLMVLGNSEHKKRTGTATPQPSRMLFLITLLPSALADHKPTADQQGGGSQSQERHATGGDTTGLRHRRLLLRFGLTLLLGLRYLARGLRCGRDSRHRYHRCYDRGHRQNHNGASQCAIPPSL